MKPEPATDAVRAAEAGPGSSAILEQLHHILGSAFFAKSKARRNLLSIVVKRALEGIGGGLKEYTLGVEALGRPESFDPRLDPAVRVNATHVRSKLAEYYAGPGAGDPVRIDLPRGGYVPAFSWNAPIAPMEASIAVIPCALFEANERDELFSDGITEELINALAQQPGIRVVARTSAWVFKGKHVDVREIGSLLNVRTVLESSLRTDGDRLRISARLSDAVTGYTLWSQNFDAGCDDALVVQEELASAIVAALKPTLRVPHSKNYSGHHLSPGEYEQWSLAKYRLNKHTNSDYEKAIEAFQKVIDMDPSFAPAYAGMAEAWFRLGVWGGARPGEAVARAESAILRALEIDPDYGLAYAYLGAIQAIDTHRLKEAERSFQTAMKLAPGSAAAKSAYAVTLLVRICRFEEAQTIAAEALALDPLSLLINVSLANIYYSARDFERAERQARKTIDLDSTFFRGWFSLGRTLSFQGRHDEAIEALRRAVELTREGTFHLETRSVYAICLLNSGQESAKKSAHIEIANLCNEGPPSVGLFWLSLALAWEGQLDEAFRMLDRAAQRGDPWISLIVCEPLADPMRGDVRYRTFVEALGLSF